MDLIQAARAVLDTPEAKKQLEYLHKGIGTATLSRVWLDLEIAIAKAENKE